MSHVAERRAKEAEMAARWADIGPRIVATLRAEGWTLAPLPEGWTVERHGYHLSLADGTAPGVEMMVKPPEAHGYGAAGRAGVVSATIWTGPGPAVRELTRERPDRVTVCAAASRDPSTIAREFSRKLHLPARQLAAWVAEQRQAGDDRSGEACAALAALRETVPEGTRSGQDDPKGASLNFHVPMPQNMRDGYVRECRVEGLGAGREHWSVTLDLRSVPFDRAREILAIMVRP